MSSAFGPYSTLKGGVVTLGGPPSWYPQEAGERVEAYMKYDQMYWNDPSAYLIRSLEGELPIYVPNARTIVDTTSHYLLKGLQVVAKDPEKDKALAEALKNLLDREMFYSQFHTAKTTGVTRGDWAFHLTADPRKPQGSRISLVPIDPSQVIPVYSEDDPDQVVRVHIVDQWRDPANPTAQTKVRKLTYEAEYKDDGTARIFREEAIYELEPKWWGPKPKLYKQIIPRGPLDESITHIPVYWFKNHDWLGQDFGSSELRGFEAMIRGVSQQATDQGMSLSLEGLGVYATDSGRPVDNDGNETDWSVTPGGVMELVSGAYFRRVEGVGTLKPSLDHIDYLETKLREASGLSDVALGRVDVQTAQSGIALAIKFMPTLAKLEQRDLSGTGKLRQMFFDWKTWHKVYEGEELTGDIEPELGQKLPANRTETVNELNNMLDRGVISKKYYRAQMQKLGYEFPSDIEKEIDDEKTKEAEQKALAAPPALQQNAQDAAAGVKPPPQSAGGAQNAPRDVGGNKSNNKNRPNESAGTESGQTAGRQARGVTPQNGNKR